MITSEGVHSAPVKIWGNIYYAYGESIKNDEYKSLILFGFAIKSSRGEDKQLLTKDSSVVNGSCFPHNNKGNQHWSLSRFKFLRNSTKSFKELDPDGADKANNKLHGCSL